MELKMERSSGRFGNDTLHFVAFYLLFFSALLSAGSAWMELDMRSHARVALGSTANTWCLVSGWLDIGGFFATMFVMLLMPFQKTTEVLSKVMRVAFLLTFLAAISECGERVVVERDLFRNGLHALSMQELGAIWCAAGAFCVGILPFAYFELTLPPQKRKECEVKETLSPDDELKQYTWFIVGTTMTLMASFFAFIWLIWQF